MKRAILSAFVAIVAVAAIAAASPQPSVGLYFYTNTDPTAGAGVSAPLNQLGIRTDTPSIYYKSGAANTAWTKIGAGTGGGTGTVTSVACGSGLSCAPAPITTTGTITLTTPSITNGAGANVITKSNGTNLVASSATDDATTFAIATNKFTVTEASGNTAIAGTGSIGGALNMNSHLINNVTDPSGAQDAATKAYVDASTAGGVNGTANTISKFTGTHAVGNSSVTDDGTTFAIATNKFTVTEASGNTAIAGTGSIGGALNMNSHLINNVTDPSGAQDAATKAYVDASTAGGVNGTANTIAKFTGTHAVGNSSVTDDGTTWAINSTQMTVTEANGNTAINGTLGVQGLATLTGGFSSTAASTVGDFLTTVIAPTAITGTIDNWAPTGVGTATYILVNTSGTVTLDGLTTGAAGRQICLIIVGGNNLTFVNEAAGSTAANRFTMVNAANWIMTASDNDTACFVYDGTASRWKQYASIRVPTFISDGLLQAGNRVIVTGQTGANSMTANFAFTAQVATDGPFLASNTGTYNATGAVRSGFAIQASNTATRSAGANAVTNIGVDTSASGAQVNWAARFNGGDVNVAANHIIATGTAPTVSVCGTTPSGSVTGSDVAGTVTIGGGTVTSCTVTFATTFGTAPSCTVTPRTAATVYGYSLSATVLTITAPTVTINGVLFDYVCIGH